MKKGNKVVLGVVSVCVALCMGVSLAACSSSEETEHTWDDGVVTTEPTCTETGVMTYTCTGCGQTKTETIDALGHSLGEGTATAATCGEDGYVTYTCTRCGLTFIEEGDKATGNHTLDYANGSYISNGKYAGYTEYTCTVCGADVKVAPIATDDDSWEDTKETDEDGNETYTVSTATELANLAANEDFITYEEADGDTTAYLFKGVTIKLGADIDLAGAEWTPIGAAVISATGQDGTYSNGSVHFGDTTTGFSGTFDGDGHTISNLRVDVSNEDGVCAGLFGYVYDGTIENLTIKDVCINGGEGVGAVVGCSDNNEETERGSLTVISNVTVTGDVQLTGSHFVGGIVGRAESTQIENCSVIADAGSYVTGEYWKEDYEGDSVGGIAGYIGVKEGYGYGYDTHNEDNSSHLYDVAVSGLTISGARKVGGLVGNPYITYGSDQTHSGDITNYVLLSSKTDEEGNQIGTGNSVTNCIISINATASYAAENSGKLFVGAAIGELTGTKNIVIPVQYCTVSNTTVKYYETSGVYGLTDMSADDTDSEEEAEEASTASFVGFYGGSRSSYNVTLSFDKTSSCSVNLVNLQVGIASDRSWLETATTTEENSEGTTYSLATAEQLVSFAEFVNTGATFENDTIKLTADMDLSDCDWIPIGDQAFNDTGYESGYDSTAEVAFCGTFDGNGKTISNLSIDTDTEYAGLFGYIYGATIKDVTIENATVSGGQDVGALVGNSGDSKDTVQAEITDCTVKGLVQITGDHFVGGMVGRGESTIISGCTVDASEGSFVKGVYVKDDYEGDAVGGLVGYLHDPTTSESGTVKTSQIIDATVSGLDISGTRKVGGIVGNIALPGGGDTSFAVITSTEGNYNTVSNCTISITVVDTYTTDEINMLFVGAIIGEFTNAGTTLANCVIGENVVINYYNASCIYAGDSANDNACAGLYGGSRTSGASATLSGCSGSASLVYIGPVVTEEAEG